MPKVSGPNLLLEAGPHRNTEAIRLSSNGHTRCYSRQDSPALVRSLDQVFRNWRTMNSRVREEGLSLSCGHCECSGAHGGASPSSSRRKLFVGGWGATLGLAWCGLPFRFETFHHRGHSHSTFRFSPHCSPEPPIFLLPSYRRSQSCGAPSSLDRNTSAVFTRGLAGPEKLLQDGPPNLLRTHLRHCRATNGSD